MKNLMGCLWLCVLCYSAFSYLYDKAYPKSAIPAQAQEQARPETPAFKLPQPIKPPPPQRFPFVDAEYDKFMAPLLRLHKAVLVTPTHASDVDRVLEECDAVKKAYDSGYSVFSDRKYMPEASKRFSDLISKVAALKSFYSFTLRPMMQQLDMPNRLRTKEDVDRVKRYASLPKSAWEKFGTNYSKFRGDVIAEIGEFGSAVDNDRR